MKPIQNCFKKGPGLDQTSAQLVSYLLLKVVYAGFNKMSICIKNIYIFNLKGKP